MANEWTDSSFELGLAGLTLEGLAQIVDSPGYWPDGSKGLLLVCSAPPPLGGSGSSSRARRTLTTTPGVSYPVSAMVALALDGSPRAPLSVQARTVGGAVLATWSTTTGTASFAPWAPGSFVATEAQTVVEWRAEQPLTGGAQWALDLISVSGPEVADVAKILEIRDAVVASLGTVTVANGYSVDLAVYDGFRPLASCKLPCAQVVMLGESKGFAGPERSALTRKEAVATFRVGYFAKATDFDSLYQIAADGEKALETVAGGQQLGLSYVRLVSVSDNDTFETEELIAQGLRALFQDVDVTYQHQRANP